MPPVSFQTLRLSPGRHESPHDGACAMELVSMLAGTSFSDRCARVCPAIAAFVRGYNDSIDDRRRQDLIRLAPDLIDTRASESTTGRRAMRCRRFACEAYAARRFRFGRPRFPHRQRALNVEMAGRIVAETACRHPGWHQRTLEFIRALAQTRAPAGPSLVAREAEPAAAPEPHVECSTM